MIDDDDIDTDEFRAEAKKNLFAINVATVRQAVYWLMYCNWMNLYKRTTKYKLENPHLSALIDFVHWIKKQLAINKGTLVIYEKYPTSHEEKDFSAFPYTSLNGINKSPAFKQYSKYRKNKDAVHLIKNICTEVDDYLSGKSKVYPSIQIDILREIIDEMKLSHPL